MQLLCKKHFVEINVTKDLSMTKPRYLTKSRFKLAAECPTKLFYAAQETQYRNLKQEDSFLAMLAEGGYQVGELAKCKYPQGVNVEPLDLVESEAMTAELLNRNQVVIFEAAVRYENLFIRADILVKDGENIELIEVKAKSYNSHEPKNLGARGAITSAMRPYIEDVAFQKYVIEKALPYAKVKSFLMMPDKAQAASMDGLNQLFKISKKNRRVQIFKSKDFDPLFVDHELLKKVPVDEYVEMVMRDGVKYQRYHEPLDVLVKKWAEACNSNQKITPDPGAYCGKCEFKTHLVDDMKSGFRECWSEAYGFGDANFPQVTVLDIYRFLGKDKLISRGQVTFDAVSLQDIEVKDEGAHLSNSERQWMQVKGIPPREDRGGYWIAEGLVKTEMSRWKFPYHFIDFETSAVALPFHREMRPYEPVAFQFSHHVMHEDGRVEHAGQFLLTESGVFPNFQFARALKAELDTDTGTVFMWSGHENTILKKIIEQLNTLSFAPPDANELSAFLKMLTKGEGRAMYDLCKLSQDAFYHVDTKGSSSIKKVLPALLKSSDWLRRRYSSPIYGAEGGIKSHNYNNFVWWSPNDNALPKDPYEFLKSDETDMLGQVVSEVGDDDLVIAEGGAAATAYARLQFEDVTKEARAKVNRALLKYCELDTLAMVMVLEGWMHAI
jgi:Domain of unknown function(DUF2779)